MSESTTLNTVTGPAVVTNLTNAADNLTASALAFVSAQAPSLSLREKILAADDITTDSVHIPEWDVTLSVKSMTGLKRAQMLKSATDPESGEMNFERLYPEIIVATVIDPTSGAYVFTIADANALNQKNGGVLERLAKAGMEVSGMDNKAETTLGKDSSEESGDSTSS